MFELTGLNFGIDVEIEFIPCWLEVSLIAENLRFFLNFDKSEVINKLQNIEKLSSRIHSATPFPSTYQLISNKTHLHFNLVEFFLSNNMQFDNRTKMYSPANYD